MVAIVATTRRRWCNFAAFQAQLDQVAAAIASD